MTTVRAALLALAILLAAVVVLSGAPIWILLAVTCLSWVILLRSQFGVTFAVAATLIGCLWVCLLVLLLTAATRAPLLVTVATVFALAGIAACLVWWRRASPPERTSRQNIAALLPAALGSIVWLVGSVANSLTRPIAGISWAMHGDAASYLLYARAVTRASGIVLGPDQNPVPIPAALLAVFMAPGRGGVSPSNLLRHDLFAYEALQILVIAVSCLLGGLLTGAIARKVSGRALIAGVAAASGSLLPLSWLLTTNALLFGYFDAELGLVVVFAGIALALSARERPFATATVLGLTSTVLLAVWSPLVVVPVGLLISIVISERKRILRLRDWRGLVLVASAVQLLAWGFAATLPSLLAQADILSSRGAIHSITQSLFPGLVLVVLLLAILALRVSRARIGVIGIVVPLALVFGLVILLFGSRGSDGGWTYFPLKFDWLSIAVLVVLMLGFLPSTLSLWMTRRSTPWIAVVAIVSMVAFVLASAPVSGSEGTESNLLSWLSQSRYRSDGGAATAAVIIAEDNPEKPTLYWQSANPNERYLNYWFLEIEARTMQNNALRKFAFAYDEFGVRDLCTILMRTPGRTTIHTLETTLPSELAARCASVSPRFVIVKD